MLNLLEAFERNLATNECDPQTVKTYAETAGRLMRYVSENFGGADFTADTVKGYMIDEWASSIAELKPSTRKLYYHGAKRFLAFLYNAQYIAFDLTPMIPNIGSLEKLYDKHPEDRPNKESYTIEQIQTMLRTSLRSREVTYRTHAMIATLVTTGMRIFEALQLNVGDVGNSSVAMVARKGTHGNLKPVSIPSQLAEYIKPYLEFRASLGKEISPESPLFMSNSGARLSKREAQHSISLLEKKLGYPTGVHTFRHTALSMASKLSDPATARDIAGQKNLTVTNRYLHSTPEEKMQTAERMANAFFFETDESVNQQVMDSLKADATRDVVRKTLLAKFLGAGYSQEESEKLADTAMTA